MSERKKLNFYHLHSVATADRSFWNLLLFKYRFGFGKLFMFQIEIFRKIAQLTTVQMKNCISKNLSFLFILQNYFNNNIILIFFLISQFIDVRLLVQL